MDVMDLGRMAIFADPTGAVFGVWQPGTFLGAGLVNEPGAISWNELNTRDAEAAKAFYGAVFGWAFEDKEMERTGTYTTIKRGRGARSAACSTWPAAVPDEVPAHWLVYFAVEDTDATLERGQGARRQRHVRADRHPRRPLRHRSPTRSARLRGDRAQRRKRWKTPDA